MSERLVFDPTPIRLDAGQGRADSTMRKARFGDHLLFLLRQRGAFQDIAYDHGRLLAPEIDAGAFPEIAAGIARAIDKKNFAKERLAATIHQTYTERVHNSLSAEFRAAIKGVAEGYRAGSATKAFAHEDVIDAMVAIEVENILMGFDRRRNIPGIRIRAWWEVLTHCLPNALDRNIPRAIGNIGRLASPRKVGAAMGRLSNPRDRIGFGCSAVTAPASATSDGKHLHARNLDNHLYRWSQSPVIALIDETPANAAYHHYVGFGSAGMIYPGGVSGMNEAGLSVSIHQLTTTRYQSAFDEGFGDIGPYIPQRVLREARSLDEAVDLARTVNCFSSWCVLVSSAAEGAAMRIEINNDQMQATRSETPMPQANHYLHPDMMEQAFDQTDGHFTPTFGKWLETRTRVKMLTAKLVEGGATDAIDTDWAIDTMASNEDHALSTPARRSFGRVPCKSYGQMTSVVRGDPARLNGGDEVWMSLGERRPACCSTIAGFTVDWDRFELEPVADKPLRRTRTLDQTPDYDASLHEFVEAVIAISRPKQHDGSPLHRDPDEAERRAMLSATNARLDQAVARAAEDGIVEVPYHYMRARVHQENNDHANALADLNLLISLWRDAGAAKIHPYEAALILTFSVQSEDIVQGVEWPDRAARLAEARKLFAEVREEYFGAAPAHHDLREWMNRLDDLDRNGGANFSPPKANFIVIE